MRLDKTRIAVRERGILELLDLSAQTLRVYFKPLLITMMVGVLPLALLNHFLLGWMSADLAYDDGEYAFRYYWNMTLLIILEAPLASVFATAYLGQAVFSDWPRVRQVVGETLRLLPRVLVCQLLTRGILIGLVLYLLIERHGPANVAIEVLLIPALLIYVLILRSVRPFINEIIVLERNPMRAKTPATITVGRRSASLHGPAGGDLFVRSMASCTFACLLTLASFSMFLFISGVFFNSWLQERFMVEVCWPMAVWIVVLFMTVLRFLCYLDLRIRQEGWEVELLLRAEAAKLTHRVA